MNDGTKKVPPAKAPEERFYRIIRLTNKVRFEDDGKVACIAQTLELESGRAATLFISQHVDKLELFEASRYAVTSGTNRIELREMRIIHPRLFTSAGAPSYYDLGVAVFAAGQDIVSVYETRCLGFDA